MGYRHLDTAQIYNNEAEVGRGMKATLSAMFRLKDQGKVIKDTRLQEIGKHYNKNAAQVALRWLMQFNKDQISNPLIC